MKLVIAFLLATTSSRLIAQDLVLRLAPPAEPIHVGDYPQFGVTVSNRGVKSVTLVHPGDGSECKWRTPVIGWSVLPAEAKEQKHPETPVLLNGLRCGYTMPIKLSAVFLLKPGESTRLAPWIFPPAFNKPGRFRVVFYYQNIPDVKVEGIAMHERAALERMKASSPCKLVSEEIVVEVLPKRLQRLQVGKGSARRIDKSGREPLSAADF